MRALVFLLIFVFPVMIVRAQDQDQDLQSKVNYRVDKMASALHLSESQSNAVRPVIKDYLSKREAFLQETAGEGVLTHGAVKNTLHDLKEAEHRQLRKILTEDQMKKWIDRENLMASLNPDSTESAVDDGPSLTAEGANFKF